jgi:cholesterol transport system auxiliary component
LLAACAGGARNAPPAEVYDFGPPPSGWPKGAGWSSVALEIRAPHWFDSLGIEYRLLYENPLKLRSYAGSRWAGAPGLLLSQRLRQQLGFVGASADRPRPACLLRLELQEFSQLFDTPQRSRACCRAGQPARREAPDRRRESGRQRAAGSRPTLAAASWRWLRPATRTRAATRDWLNDLEKRGTLKGCRLTAGESQ